MFSLLLSVSSGLMPHYLDVHDKSLLEVPVVKPKPVQCFHIGFKKFCMCHAVLITIKIDCSVCTCCFYLHALKGGDLLLSRCSKISSSWSECCARSGQPSEDSERASHKEGKVWASKTAPSGTSQADESPGQRQYFCHGAQPTPKKTTGRQINISEKQHCAKNKTSHCWRPNSSSQW